MKLTAAASHLLVIDVQERLMPAISESERVIASCALLLEAAAQMSVPVLVSQQYPKGLGATMPVLLEKAGTAPILDKTHFSCMGDEAIAAHLGARQNAQYVLAGVEAHVCVAQTALDMRAKGCAVAVVADAISSRTEENKTLGIERMRAAGVDIVSTEMVVFEWVGRAGTPAFKALAPLLK